MARHKKYVYEHVVDVLLAARISEQPETLAKRVKKLCPSSNYRAVRICEDIGHILRRDGRFIPKNVQLTASQFDHVSRMREHMKTSGSWITRASERR